MEFLGYFALRAHFGLKMVSRFPGAQVSRRSGRGVDGDGVLLFPAKYNPGDDPMAQIEFALRYEGVDLALLKALFAELGATTVRDFVAKRPAGVYRRRIWFLYEWLMGHQLDHPDLGSREYIPLLNPEREYVSSGVRVPRQKLWNNLLGDRLFCPLVQRTEELEMWEQWRLDRRVAELTQQHDPALLHRAMFYLFTKETRASFAIERETPGRAKTDRFVHLLRDLPRAMIKEELVKIQQEILDARYAEADYRTEQNYVGEELGDYRIRVHYIPPKPEDVEELMTGWLKTAERLSKSDCPPPVAAAALSFGFVFIHPFLDGNGRLHRFMIHNVLAKLRFTPPGIVFPISAAILRNEREYDRILESVSEPLLSRIDYELGPRGELSVRGESADLYRYLDYTAFASYLYRCIEQTVEIDFPEELAALERYDQMRIAIREIVDLPDRKLDLLIRCLWQNGGKLSARKRAKFFPELTKEEIAEIELAGEHVAEAQKDKGQAHNDGRN